jgi:hypothetical protein
MIVSLYKNEYLRLPTSDDIKAITKLHKFVHNVDGMLGSLDCTHTYWKNCPVGWKGSYQGQNSAPSIVLEAVCDYNLFFWHLNYGNCGCLNDINILNRSPLLDMMVDGTLHALEREAGVVPFQINDQEFDKVFVLVDGIYPSYNRFVKSQKNPITTAQQRLAAWQEAVRKDIERAFDVFKGQWQVFARPLLLHHVAEIAYRASCCFILHNMNVSDRIMGDCRSYYHASAAIDDMEEEEFNKSKVRQPDDLIEVQTRYRSTYNDNLKDKDKEEREERTQGYKADWVMQTRGEIFRDICDITEFQRLHKALLDEFGFRCAAAAADAI